MKTKSGGVNVKTTVLIPEDLWVKARQRALDERTNLRALILEGLELRLRQKGGRHGVR